MIAVVKYNGGNITSILNALHQLGVEAQVTDDASTLIKADKVILPGVGEASSAMHSLRERGLDTLIPTLTQPFLGICLGMQILCNHSEEGDTDCLGVFNTEVRRFPSDGIVPHMGWNDIYDLEGRMFDNVAPHSDVYFVHSYFADVCSETTAKCNYMLPFGAAMQRGNFYGVQFHTEKSSNIGLKILKNFIIC